MNAPEQLDRICITTIRTLSIDAVQKANSGHPGTPMGMAPAAYCLRQRILLDDPNDPGWLKRDRFMQSAGHACALPYGLLYVCGVRAVGESYETTDRLAMMLDDLKTFRRAGSRCTVTQNTARLRKG